MKASGNKWLCTLSRQVDHAPASILQDQRDAPMATGELDVFANNLHDTVMQESDVSEDNMLTSTAINSGAAKAEVRPRKRRRHRAGSELLPAPAPACVGAPDADPECAASMGYRTGPDASDVAR